MVVYYSTVVLTCLNEGPSHYQKKKRLEHIGGVDISFGSNKTFYLCSISIHSLYKGKGDKLCAQPTSPPNFSQLLKYSYACCLCDRFSSSSLWIHQDNYRLTIPSLVQCLPLRLPEPREPVVREYNDVSIHMNLPRQLWWCMHLRKI